MLVDKELLDELSKVIDPWIDRVLDEVDKSAALFLLMNTLDAIKNKNMCQALLPGEGAMDDGSQ